MDQLFKQFGGGMSTSIQDLFGNQANDDQNEELLDDEQLMENIRVTHEIFIQNLLNATSHTVQWLPHQTQDSQYSNFNREYFLLGTHLDEENEVNEENVYIASIRVPKSERTEKNVIDYKRIPKDISSLEIIQRFKHVGEVNKARAMIQDWRIFASIANTGEVSLYQYDENNQRGYQVEQTTLKGLDQEGFGLSWNPFQKGLLIASTGQQICLWDTADLKINTPSVKVENAHEKGINDVKFSNINPYLFGTASDDSNYKIWDSRNLKSSSSFTHCYKASDDDLLVLSFNHKNEYLFATGGEQSGILHVWDMRLPKHFINDLVYHKGQVNQIEWSPFSENIFMSSGIDGKIFVWDHSKTGEEQARHDYEDGPPEMIFPHDAHQKSCIEDIQWSPNNENLVVSCDTDLKMQVWKMSDDFLFNEVDYLDKLNNINEVDLE